MAWAVETTLLNGDVIGRIVEDGDTLIAEVIGCLDSCGNDENAYLMAAAPELRSACIHAAHAIRSGRGQLDAMNKLNAAIAASYPPLMTLPTTTGANQ